MGEAEEVCWTTDAYDSSGKLQVKIWDAAFRSLCGITADRLREIWDEGVEKEEERDVLIEELNMHSDCCILMSCTGSVWVSGGKEKKHAVQVNVNAIDVLTGEA